VDVSGRTAATAEALAAATMPWAEAAHRARTETGGEALEARQYLLDSPLVAASPALAAYGAASFPADRPLNDAVSDLVSRVHRDFAYRSGATSVTTTLAEVLDRRAGVCQDFAHIVTGCLRSLGLPARYVSGYLETDPPPGMPRLQGADSSHAWASVFVPGVGWIDMDPTNDVIVGDRHVTTAWGRDYGDVPPLKGVIFTDATEHELHVSVDVTPVDDVDANAAALPA
jgi:transglutaminase-like putative cysteine protease